MNPVEIEKEWREMMAKADKDYEAALAEAGAIFEAAEAEVEAKRGKPPDVDNEEYWEMIWPAFEKLREAQDAARLVFRGAMGAARDKIKAEMETTQENIGPALRLSLGQVEMAEAFLKELAKRGGDKE